MKSCQDPMKMWKVKVLNFNGHTKCRREGVYEKLRYPMMNRLVQSG